MPNINVRIDAVKPFSKNTLIAFVDLTLLPVNLRISGATVHQKNGSKWISLPSRPYTENNETKYAKFLEFTTREAHNEFQQSALEAYDSFKKGPAQ